MNKNYPYQKIIFVDGYCNLCNSFVSFILSIDRREKFHFSSLQGETAQKLNIRAAESIDTVTLYLNGHVFEKSTAVLKVLKTMGGVWSLFYLLIFLPSGFRDWVYDFIARHRYQWFGRKETCDLSFQRKHQHRMLP